MVQYSNYDTHTVPNFQTTVMVWLFQKWNIFIKQVPCKVRTNFAPNNAQLWLFLHTLQYFFLKLSAHYIQTLACLYAGMHRWGGLSRRDVEKKRNDAARILPRLANGSLEAQEYNWMLCSTISRPDLISIIPVHGSDCDGIRSSFKIQCASTLETLFLFLILSVQWRQKCTPNQFCQPRKKDRLIFHTLPIHQPFHRSLHGQLIEKINIKTLKVPKRENFSLAFFALSEPIWVCDLGSGKKNRFFY